MYSRTQTYGWTFVLAVVGVVGLANRAAAQETTRVRFDIPERIECRDATPEKYAAAHPTMKVIEAKFRISAKFVEGDESNIVDFDYMISSPEMRFDVIDFLPNTTLESTYTDDRIEVADFSESGEASRGEANVGYSISSLNAAKSQFAKRQEHNLYQRIAPKALVLASGTVNRGHGVFYKLRPSKNASLEGAKDFTFLAIVPKTWRGDWCTFMCLARYNKKQLVSTAVTLAGVENAHVGMYIVGDATADELSAKLCQIQQANDGLLSRQFARSAAKAAETAHVTTAPNPALLQFDEFVQHLLNPKADDKSGDRQLDAARREMLDVEQQLADLAGPRVRLSRETSATREK